MNMADPALSAFELTTDEEIVARVVGGEKLLFELLMRRHNPRVYRTIRAILGRSNPDEVRKCAVAVAATHTWDRVAHDYLEVIDRAWAARQAGAAPGRREVASRG